MGGKRARRQATAPGLAAAIQKLLEQKPDIAEPDEASPADGESWSRSERIALALIRKAMQGDLAAAKFIRDAAEEPPGQAAAPAGRYTITLRVREDGG